MGPRALEFRCVPLLLVCVMAIFLTAIGCGNGDMPATVFPQNSAVGTGQAVQFVSSLGIRSSRVVWQVSSGTISSDGLFTAPSEAGLVKVTATSASNPTRSASATVIVMTPGQVTATANSQVAKYTIAPPAAGNVYVQFGIDRNYGLNTGTQPIPSGGGPVSLLVAGMKANSQYHMRAVVNFVDGTQYLDPDLTFTTGDPPTSQLPAITVTTTPGAVPQSGVELLDLITYSGNVAAIAPVAVTDLQGNILWSYNPGLPLVPNPVKILPNGHLLINFSSTTTGYSVMQEIDLTGQLIWQMTADQLNQALAAATCPGCNITVLGTTHDFVLLPNGHLVVLAAIQQQISGITVSGDVVIDLDQNRNPVWLWNEFDHLDVNRRPMGFPDWTHSNAILYSPDDGNLIVSIRHQNWLVKIDYANGTGAGDILWHLGYQGDVALLGGTDPIDWFYAQHGPSFVGTSTAGKFTLAVFDNGDDRVFPPGVTCGAAGAPPCFYSTAQVFDIDENAKTATLVFHPTAPTYSFFGGNNEVLANGNLEFCESAEPTQIAGDIYEITQGSSPTTVWHMTVTGQYVYRGKRIPSLYPGVQW